MEIDISGNSIGPGGALALASALSTAGPGLRLMRLTVGSNGLDSAATAALQAAGAERGVVVTM